MSALVVAAAAATALDVTTGVGGGVTVAVDEVDTGWPAVGDVVAVLGEAAGSNSRRIHANAVNRSGACNGAAGLVVPASPLSDAAGAVVATVIMGALTSAAGAGVAATGAGTGATSGTTGAGVLAFVAAPVSVAFSVGPAMTVSTTGVDASSTRAVRVAAGVNRLCTTDFGADWRTDEARGAPAPVGMVGDLPMVDATSAPPRPVVEWESAVVVERPLDADLWPIDDVGLPVWPDER